MGSIPGLVYTRIRLDVEFQGRHVRFYKVPIPRSTALLNMRFLPVPTEPKVVVQGALSVPTHGSQVLIPRPQGYFSRERDPVPTDNKIATDEPAGFPLNDAFVFTLPTPPTQVITVASRKEIIAARPSADLAMDLPLVDFLW